MKVSMDFPFLGLSLDTVQKIKAGYKIFIMTVNELGKLALKTQSGLRLDLNNGKLYTVFDTSEIKILGIY